MKFQKIIKEVKLDSNNYKNNSLYKYKADYEMPEKEYEEYINRLKKQFPKKSIEDLKKEHQRKFTGYAMGKKAFQSKYWNVYKNPEYKGEEK